MYTCFMKPVCIFSHITEDGLQSMFETFGNIVQKNILINKHTGLSRGVAFVRWVVHIKSNSIQIKS